MSKHWGWRFAVGSLWILVLLFVFGAVQASSGVLLYENFEDGVLNSAIEITSVGDFIDPAGIKDLNEFGSSKAFGFGRSNCGASCLGSYTTNMKIDLGSSTYISTISFKEMELYGNWGSGGIVTIDGVSLHDPDYEAFGKLPYNDGTADTSYRIKTFQINQSVRNIELKVWDITTSSEIFIDDLLILGYGNLPRTGQGKCYDSYGAEIDCGGTGQDGDVRAGIPWPDPRFTDNGDGTVSDTLTGLTWLQNGNCLGSATWQQALAAANSLASGECGLSDGSVPGQWRLPNVNELESLMHAGYEEEDCGGSGCATNAAWLNFRGFINVQAAYYWSSTTYEYLRSSALVLSMWVGLVDYGLKGNNAYILPVKGENFASSPAPVSTTGQTSCYDSSGTEMDCEGTGQDGEIQAGFPLFNPRFLDNGDGTVTDSLTGLVWLKSADCFYPDTWWNALSLVNSISDGQCWLTDGSLAGDWRLPNVKELRSLIDHSKANPALQSGHPFTEVQAGPYWTSTTYLYDEGMSRIVSISGGVADKAGKSSSHFIWPVRGSGWTCVPPPTGMFSWWNAENSPLDIAGTNHGTLVNGTSYGRGKVGYAFSFDGVDDYVEISGSDVGDFGYGPFTVDFWMYSNNDGNNTYILGKSHPDGGLGWDIRLDQGKIRVSGVNGWGFNITSDPYAAKGSWHHVALAATDTEVNLYIDGVLRGCSARSGITTTSNPFRLGYATNFGGSPFQGFIDEVEIFQRALGAGEIQAIYSAGSSGKCRPRTYSLIVQKQGTGTGAVSSNPEGISCGADCGKVYHEGTQVALTAVADSGSSFMGWGGDCDINGQVIMDGDKTCTATFSLNQYAITATAAPVEGGSVHCEPNPVDHGAVCSCSIYKNEGYSVESIQGTCGGALAGDIFTTNPVTADCTVTVVFVENTYTLSISKSGTGSGSVKSTPQGILCGADCDETYTAGTEVILQATADAGSSFSGWGGDPDCSDGQVTMSADKSCAAIFTAVASVRLVSPNGSEMIPAGGTVAVQWEGPGNTHHYTLKLSLDGGRSWSILARNITANSYNWTVPKPARNKTNCLMKVIAYDLGDRKIGEDDSDSVFTIEVLKLISPNGGESLASGSKFNIGWTTNQTRNPVSKTLVLYSLNGGLTWRTIDRLEGNPESYEWTVPTVSSPKTRCKVRVIMRDSLGNTVGVDTTDGLFSIGL